MGWGALAQRSSAEARLSPRARLLAAAGLATGVVAATLVLEGALGPRPAALPRRAPPQTAAWLCPHGGGEGWRAWIALANPGPDESNARISTFGSEGAAGVLEVSLLPGTQQLVEVPGASMATGSFVERFGSRLGAGWVVQRPEGGLAAEPCAPRGSRRWLVPGGSAERGRRAWLVLLNPFATDAVADVELRLSERSLRPGELRGLVLPAGRAMAVDLNAFALGERALGPSVEVAAGRLAASVVTVSDGPGLSAAVGVPRAARRWVLPGAADDGPSELVVSALEEDVPITAGIQGSAGESEAIADAAVAAHRSAAFEVPATASGLVVGSEGRAPMAAARGTSLSTAGDAALTSGRPAAGASWVVPAGLPAEGGRSVAILENPGTAPAQVAVTLLTAGGAAPAPGSPVTVPPGQTAALELTEAAGGQPVGFAVQTATGTIVAALASITQTGYAISTGLRLAP